jgi:hypothetical protein
MRNPKMMLEKFIDELSDAKHRSVSRTLSREFFLVVCVRLMVGLRERDLYFSAPYLSLT